MPTNVSASKSCCLKEFEPAKLVHLHEAHALPVLNWRLMRTTVVGVRYRNVEPPCGKSSECRRQQDVSGK